MNDLGGIGWTVGRGIRWMDDSKGKGCTVCRAIGWLEKNRMDSW